MDARKRKREAVTGGEASENVSDDDEDGHFRVGFPLISIKYVFTPTKYLFTIFLFIGIIKQYYLFTLILKIKALFTCRQNLICI